MASKYRVGLLDENRHDEWADLVGRAPLGSIYSDPSYLSALTTATGGSFRVVVVEKGEQIVGGVALYEETSPGGLVVSPRLLLYLNGFVLAPHASRYPHRETSVRLSVLHLLETWLRTAGYGRIDLRSGSGLTDVRPLVSSGWVVHPSYSYLVPIADLAQAWSRIDQNLRRLIRRAEHAGIEVMDDDDFDGFFRLHSATMGRKGHRPYLEEGRFRRFFTTLRGLGMATLFNARTSEGTLAASTLVLLGRHATARTVVAASNVDYHDVGANPLLRWRSFVALNERGHAFVDLTDASLNEVTRFKAQLGGDLVTLFQMEAPRSFRYRVWHGAGAAYHSLRAAAGSLRRGREAP